MPLRRALVAKRITSSMTASGFCSRLANTRPIFLTAPSSVRTGVVTSTAPSVPPNTISAAVSCATSRMLPPSRIRPPRIPPSARISPPQVARSSLTRPLLAFAGSAAIARR
jgi:hypothetical protein